VVKSSSRAFLLEKSLKDTLLPFKSISVKSRAFSVPEAFSVAEPDWQAVRKTDNPANIARYNIILFIV
jgi:hypothetical protein